MNMKRRTIDMTHARLYVTTRKAYASGDRFGYWMDVRRYSGRKAFMDAFRELYPQEEEPALLILDWQDLPRRLASKEGVSPRIFRLSGYASALDTQTNRAFHLWLEEMSAGLAACPVRETIRLFEASYRGYYPRAGDFGRHYALEMLAIPAATNPGFDYIRFEEQLLSGGFTRVGEYVFSRSINF